MYDVVVGVRANPSPLTQEQAIKFAELGSIRDALNKSEVKAVQRRAS